MTPSSRKKIKTNFHELKKIFQILNGPKGCPWDRRQTHQSLVKYLREEVREFVRALDTGHVPHIREELGDILLLVMFNAQLASQKEWFDIEDVIDTLIKKLKRRHPHVFGNIKVTSHRQLVKNWELIKASEKADAQRSRASGKRQSVSQG